jgi:hypothetical protein
MSMSSASSTNPIISPCASPGGVPSLVNVTKPYCGVALQQGNYQNTSAAMRACCNGADFIIPEDGCHIYCQTVGQTADQQTQCLSFHFGAQQGDTQGILCSSDATRQRRGLSLVEIMIITAIVGSSLVTGFTL